MHARTNATFSGLLVTFVLLVTMVAPLVGIHFYGVELADRVPIGAGEVTVGIAAVLRATLRRVLRGASTNLMRTTAGALGRTSARAVTRRVVKFTGRLFFGSILQQTAKEADGEELIAPRTAFSQFVAVALGYAALCCSFWGVLYVSPEGVVQDVTSGQGLTYLEVVLLAGLPLLVYASFHQLFGRLFGVTATYRTEFDGLLLQAYFTGAGSFLPLTTDVEYEGGERSKRLLAICSLASMFLAHVVLRQVALQSADPGPLGFVSAMFLVYAFVYAFPIKPLEGYFIWATSKWQWALVAGPILYAFLNWMPPVFGEIL